MLNTLDSQLDTIVLSSYKGISNIGTCCLYMIESNNLGLHD